MGYRERQRLNPTWPKRMCDWKGRRVKLLSATQNRGGTKFKAGEIVEVVATYCSKLGLSNELGGNRLKYISNVNLRDVKLLPKGLHERDWSGGDYVSLENGKSSIRIECPFCGASFIAYVWSLAGSGKKCKGCGALHGSFGIATRTIQQMRKADQ